MDKNFRRLLSLTLIIALTAMMVGFTYDSKAKDNDNYVAVNGDRIYFEQSGNLKSSDTLIFVHGAFMHSKAMNFLSKEFKKYNCITLDLPGHGKSEGTAKSTVAEYTDSVEQFIKILQDRGTIKSNFTLIGWSMGGTISLELAERHVVGLNNVVLLNSSAKWYLDTSAFDPNSKIDLRPLFGSEFTSLTPDKVKAVFSTDYDKYISSDKAVISDVMSVCNYDAVSALSNIEVPILALSGDSDHLALPQYQALLKSNIKECYLKIYPNRGHQMFMEIPDDLEEDIKDFFEYSK